MSKNDEIFVNQGEDDIPKSPQDIKYIHNTESADYISQFLLQEASLEMFRDKHQSAPLFLEQIGQINQEEEERKQPGNNNPKRIKSLFHNFQKHLVITLKNIVKINNPQHEEYIPKIAFQMWSIFVKSHLYTKTILHILYGVQCDEQQCSFTSAMLNRFGFVNLFNKYSDELVKEAQQYLRKETIKAFKKVTIKQYLSRRRMVKAEEFEDYLNEFIEELSQGPIKRRIPKKKKKNLKTYQKSINAAKTTVDTGSYQHSKLRSHLPYHNDQETIQKVEQNNHNSSEQKQQQENFRSEDQIIKQEYRNSNSQGEDEKQLPIFD